MCNVKLSNAKRLNIGRCNRAIGRYLVYEHRGKARGRGETRPRFLRRPGESTLPVTIAPSGEVLLLPRPRFSRTSGRIEWLDGHCIAGVHDFRLTRRIRGLTRRIEWLSGHCIAGIHDFRQRRRFHGRKPGLSRRESWAPAPRTIEATPLPCLLFATSEDDR